MFTDVNGRLRFEDPKSRRGFRTVPLADLALDKLEAHVATFVGTGDPRALLFTSPGGALLRASNWRAR